MDTRVLVALLICGITFVLGSPFEPLWQPRCPRNEEYARCSIARCHQTCRSLVVPTRCPQVAANCFDPDCVCKNNYFRNDQGKCVSRHMCFRRYPHYG
ncbi:venom peptide CtAPI-like [Anticarsia gemmatalis]|uniref:venom peptide CtAPI-like n=1 Tax=Anticarsia gemmatalis TaxID=129554 RepID=UPI003F768FE6